MRRRAILAMLGGSAIGLPWAARAQIGQDRPSRIGILFGGAESEDNRAPLIDTLSRLGRINGKTAAIEERVAAGDAKRAQSDAEELVRWSADVLIALSSVATMSLRKATRTIPIVFANVSDPVGAGFVKSLAQPGGNITGFTNFEYGMGVKWLDLLRQIAPDTTRVAVVFNPDNPGGRGHLASVEKAAPAFGMGVIPVGNLSAAKLADSLKAFAQDSRGGVLVTPSAWGLAGRTIIELTNRNRLPAIFPHRASVAAGGVLYYGIDRAESIRGAAEYADRILKGAKPGELPVQAPTKYELMINLNAAKALGLAIPPSLLARANEVIE